MENTQVLLNIVWTMVGAFLVYFMQAGFAMVETGFTRAKNSGNILMKNMMDFVLGSIFFFIIGFALMFGVSEPPVFFIRNRWQMQTACSTDCRSVYS